MGYACPVCTDPQADGEHLANHLAFTAILGDEEHERWLDEHVPDWGDRDPEGLAPEVTDRATETDHEPVSAGDPTAGRSRDESGPRDARFEDELAAHGGYGRDAAHAGAADPETEQVLREARELTAEMRADDGAAETEAGVDDGAAETEAGADEDVVETDVDGGERAERE